VLVIVGGGAVDPALLHELKAAGARLIAADGGADRVAAAGLVPEIIIGDLDSLDDPDAWSQQSRLVRITEQETTDFEKALYSTEAPVTVALGMTGKRFDHTLAALDALARHAAKRRIVLVDDADIAVALTGRFSFRVAPGERVSIHPLAPVAFRSSEGLKYPLDGLELAPGVRTGTSNEAVTGRFTIVPERGSEAPYLLIIAGSHLGALIAALLRPEAAGAGGGAGG